MNVTRLEVIASEQLKSQKGNVYQLLQCILHGQRIVVGKLRVYGDMAKEPINPGHYLAEFDWGEGFGDGQAGFLVPRLVSLVSAPVARPATPKPAA